MKHLKLLVVIALLAQLADANAQTKITATFNTAADFANNFNIYQNTATPSVVSPGAATSPYSQVSGVGAGGGGGIAVSTGGSITADSTATYKTSSFNFANSGTTLTVSSSMNVSANTATGNRLLQLGFVNENTSGMNGNAGLAFMSLRLSTAAASGNVYQPQYQQKDAAGGTVNTTFPNLPNVTLIPGEWYQLSGTFVNEGSGTFQMSGTLKDFGSDGTTPGDTVFTFPTQTLTGVDIANDSSVWPAFRGFKTDGLNAVDSFVATSAIPEPGTWALMGFGISGLLLAARRRR